MKRFYNLFFCVFVVSLGQSQIINFPDANFKARLLLPNASSPPFDIDENNDGEIQVSEAQQVTGLDISNSNISDLTGISYFTSLIYLNCSDNLLTTLTIDEEVPLIILVADHNLLTSVDVKVTAAMSINAGLRLNNNNLTSFVIKSGSYESVDLSYNQLTSLTINNAAHMEYLNVNNNQLSAIQVNGSASVSYGSNFTNNQFTFLDLSNINFSGTVSLGNNPSDVVRFGHSPDNITYTSQNTFVDLGNFSGVRECGPYDWGRISLLNCPNLQHVILKNGFNHTARNCNEGGDIFQSSTLNLQIENCPNLSFICVDELERPYIQARINLLQLQNQVQVNSYCTFTPGGTYYTINGITRLDNGTNGCDSADISVPYQKFEVTNGTVSETIISDVSGNYNIYTGANSHTVTPVLPNSGIYAVSPPSMTVNFPANASPYTQNFCLTAIGNHPDVEVSFLPTDTARPGFDANYTLMYKNKGNQIQSGAIHLAFNDSVLDFISANPANSALVPNLLTWDFSNLQPFESREILVILNVNSPMETPAVNADDILTYTASITGLQNDATPEDNTATLNQTVFNSFDPNDKTCLEGNVVGPDMIGKYVHYLIRFENTGTFSAENIVVKDLIDVTKFDVASLVPLNGSHSFVTKISETNKVEFIFQNINLPFDDANNDGYVAFKIKTKPDLVIGNSFSNAASIYFDYNFPIITDPAVTTIQALGTGDFEFSKYFTIWPNPVKNHLSVAVKADLVVSSVRIYNMLGQLLQVETSENLQSLDVSHLKSGNYILKIASDKGTSVAKFIKE